MINYRSHDPKPDSQKLIWTQAQPTLDQCRHQCPQCKGAGCEFVTVDTAAPCELCWSRGVVSDEQYARFMVLILQER